MPNDDFGKNGKKGGGKGGQQGGQKGHRGHIQVTGLMTECQQSILNNKGAATLLRDAWERPTRIVVSGPSAVHA